MSEEKYTKGFNSGYILAGHKPELLQTVTQNLPPTNDYVTGLMDGKEQLELEKTKDQMSEMEQLRNRFNGRENELGRE